MWAIGKETKRKIPEKLLSLTYPYWIPETQPQCSKLSKALYLVNAIFQVPAWINSQCLFILGLWWPPELSKVNDSSYRGGCQEKESEEVTAGRMLTRVWRGGSCRGSKLDSLHPPTRWLTTICNSSSRGSVTLFWPPQVPTCMWCNTYMQTKHPNA